VALKYAKRALAAGHERVAAGTPAPASLLDEVETDVFEALIKKATGEADALEIPASILEKQAHMRSVFGYEAEGLIPQLHQAQDDLGWRLKPGPGAQGRAGVAGASDRRAERAARGLS